MTWTNETAWIFPPVGLLDRVVCKVGREQATASTVTPVWCTQPWFTLLVEHSIRTPILLEGNPRTLLTKGETTTWKRLSPTETKQWAIWRISEEVKAFRQTLSRSASKSENLAHGHHTTQTEGSSVCRHTPTGEQLQFQRL